MRLIKVSPEEMTKEFLEKNEIYVKIKNRPLSKIGYDVSASVPCVDLLNIKVFKLEEEPEEEWINYQEIEWVDGNEYKVELDDKTSYTVTIFSSELLIKGSNIFLTDKVVLKWVTDAKYKKVEQ